MKTRVFIFIVTIAFIAGCSSYKREPEFNSQLNENQVLAPYPERGQDSWPPFSAIYTQRFIWKMQYMAEQLREKLDNSGKKMKSVLMTTIVPVNDLERATGFGRLCSEQLITEMSKLGFNVIETRKTGGLMVLNNEGEFALSRNLKLIKEQHRADAVFVGTYIKSDSHTLLNVRLVNTETSDVMAAATAMMNIRGDKFLQAVFEADEKGEHVELPLASISIRKKVLPGVDHYSEIMQSMTGAMARKMDEESGSAPAQSKTLAVTTFVDVDNMYRASTFGRYITEQVMEQYSRMGYNVIELRAAPSVYVDVRIGELALSREMSRTMGTNKVDTLVVGTYTRAGDKVMVNARMVKSETRMVVSAGSMIVDAGEKNKFITAMLKNEVTSIPPTETVEGY